MTRNWFPLFMLVLATATLIACNNQPQFPVSSATETAPIVETAELAFTEADSMEILRQTLTQISYVSTADFLSQDGSEIVLSTVNLPPTYRPDPAKSNLLLLTPAEIQVKADADGDFLYLRLEKIEAESPTQAESVLCSIWAIAADSNTDYLSGGCITVAFSKDVASGTWQGEITATTIS